MEARRVELDVVYEGKNISKQINSDLISFAHSDNAQGIADDISILLQDKDGKWLTEWVCDTSDTVEASITAKNWEGENDNFTKKCGVFIVDEPEYTITPGTFALNAISIPANENFRDVKRTKNWNRATISKIATTIANNSGLTLVYDSSFNPIVAAKEQTETSDMEFLQEICNAYGLVLKIYRNKLVIFSEAEYEKKPSVLTIRKDMLLPRPTLKRTLTDSGYDGARLRYKKSDGTLITASYFPTGKRSKVLPLNENVEDQAEALRICKNRLREKNRKDYKISFGLSGIAKINAGNCVTLEEDFGSFNGKYFIEQIKQGISPTSYSFEAHKVLGY